jgi:pyruvate dehydrogenase E1 component alpha subunit
LRRNRREGRISACFFGDGAVNQGNFTRLNWARLESAGPAYLREQLYGIGTEVQRSSAHAQIHKRTCGYDVLLNGWTAWT